MKSHLAPFFSACDLSKLMRCRPSTPPQACKRKAISMNLRTIDRPLEPNLVSLIANPVPSPFETKFSKLKIYKYQNYHYCIKVLLVK